MCRFGYWSIHLQFLSGKGDLFGLVLAFRYLLPKQNFLAFKASLIRTLNQYMKNSKQIIEIELLSMMGFPANWKNITRFHI